MIGLYGHLQRFELSWDPQWVNVEAEVQQIAQSPPYGLHPPVLISWSLMMLIAVPNEKQEAVDSNSGTGNHVTLMWIG